MRIDVTVTWKRIVLSLVALLALAMLAGMIVAWSGVYSVAASRGHPLWLNWFLELGMRRSVEANAPDLEQPDLNDRGLISLGASHFQGGCAPCHGAPGEPVNPIYQAMLPVPPKLRDQAPAWSDDELHWIIKHGLQYAGMPGWAGTGRDDEIWAMVAFLRVLPEMDGETYFDLAAGNSQSEEPSVIPLVREGSGVSSLATCSKCHGTATRPPASLRVPRLGGQNEAYLARALREYRHGERESGFMEPVAAEIPEQDFAGLAEYFAALDAPPHSDSELLAPERIERGRELALYGDGDGVAACQSCHGGAGWDDYPLLEGQSAVYIEAQLTLWKEGGRDDTAYGKLMGAIAETLDEQQIRDLAAFYASQPAFGPDSKVGDEPSGAPE